MHARFALLSVVLLLVVTAVSPASAGYEWCLTDPNIRLPDGGVVHLLTGVPQEFKGAAFDLAVWAPAGSRIVGSTHGINVTLHEGPANQITAAANASFPVMLVTKFREETLAPGEVVFMTGQGTATWAW